MAHTAFSLNVFDFQNPPSRDVVGSFVLLAQKVFGKHGPSLGQISARFSSTRTSIRPYLVLISEGAIGKGNIVGGGVYTYSNYSKSFYIDWFFVDTSLRSRGLGSFLVRTAEKELLKKEPQARFFVAETIPIRQRGDVIHLEDPAQTIARAKFWERQGYSRTELPGKNIGPKGIEWDLRIKDANNPHAKTVSARTVAKLLIDLHRNPLVDAMFFPTNRSLRISGPGKSTVRRALRGLWASDLKKRPRIPK